MPEPPVPPPVSDHGPDVPDGAIARLFLMRHGIADEEAPEVKDQGLTSKGRKKVEKAVQGMATLGVAYDVLLTSPILRAQETAALVAEQLGGEPVTIDALDEMAPPIDALKAIRPYLADGQAVFVVSHEPVISGVMGLLFTGDAQGLPIRVKRAGLAAMHVPKSGTAALHGFYPARALRKLR